MKKFLITLMMVAMVAVLPACRSKCAPLDRTYPSRAGIFDSTPEDFHQENERIRLSRIQNLARSDCPDNKKLAMMGDDDFFVGKIK